MITEKQKIKIIGAQPRKRLGFSQDYGLAYFGFCLLGDNNMFSGTYQKHYVWNKPYFIKKRIYYPVYKRTKLQGIQRNKFSRSIARWHEMLEAKRNIYNERAKGKNLSGYNLFISEYMRDN